MTEKTDTLKPDARQAVKESLDELLNLVETVLGEVAGLRGEMATVRRRLEEGDGVHGLLLNALAEISGSKGLYEVKLALEAEQERRSARSRNGSRQHEVPTNPVNERPEADAE